MFYASFSSLSYKYIIFIYNNHEHQTHTKKIKKPIKMLQKDNFLKAQIRLKCVLILFNMFVLFICLGFYVPIENFSIYGVVTIIGERLQNLTYARYSWLLCSEGSLACYTYCVTRHPFIMVISENLSQNPPSLHGWNIADTA